MAPNILILGLGAMLLLVGIVGGGFEIKEFKVPKVGPVPRAVAAIAGLIFITLGIRLGTTETAVNHEPVRSAVKTPVKIRIYDRLGENRVSEQATVLIDGEIKGKLAADLTDPESMLLVTLPHRGRYSYSIDASRTVNVDGQFYRFSGIGQGMIDAEDGKRFDLVESMSGDTWLVTIMESPAGSPSEPPQANSAQQQSCLGC